MLPAELIVIPIGKLKLALVPVPLAYVPDPLPASIDTRPPDVTLRITLLLLSATYTFPDESTATPAG
jgi:hypothetical protein